MVRNVGFTLEGWVNANTNTPVIVAGWAGTNGNVGPLLLANYPPPLGNGPGSFSVAFTNLTVAETNSTGVVLGTAGGLVAPGATVTNTIYAVFTELTNLNSEAIKFAVPPFVSDTRRRVLAASTFDVPRTGISFHLRRICGWLDRGEQYGPMGLFPGRRADWHQLHRAFPESRSGHRQPDSPQLPDDTRTVLYPERGLSAGAVFFRAFKHGGSLCGRFVGFQLHR